MKKTYYEELLKVCGIEIWPQAHNDPTIKGPQPRIISKRLREALGKMKRESTLDEDPIRENMNGAKHEQK